MFFLSLIMDPIDLWNQVRIRWFTKFIIVEYKSTHIWFNYFSTWSENIKLGFGYIYHHFIGFKPIHCILQFLFHVNWVVFFKILLTQISLQVCLWK